jgi:hypothetical protein
MKNKYLKRIKFTLCFCGWLLAFTNLVKAQENQTIQSTLTLVTTDIMNSNIDNNLNWKNITLKKLVNSNLYTYTKDGSNCTPTGNFVAVSSPEGVLMCPECKEGGWDCADVKVQSVKTFIEPPENPKSGSGLSFNNSSFIPWSAGLNSGLTLWGFVNNSPNDLAGGGSNNGDEQNTSPNDNPNKPQTGLEDDEKNIINILEITKQPEKEPCNDSLVSKASVYLTMLIDTLKNTAQMIDLKDSLQVRPFEVGMGISKYNSGIRPYKYNKDGVSYSVEPEIDNYSLAVLHTHPLFYMAGYEAQPSHSLPDMYTLISFYNKFGKCKSSFVISAKDTQQFALHIEDTAKLHNFTNNPANAKDSLINFTNGYLSWVGDDDDEKTLKGKFIKSRDKFMEKGYSQFDAEYFAQIYMYDKVINLGIGSYKKIDGKFKRVKIKTSPNGKDYDVLICDD